VTRALLVAHEAENFFRIPDPRGNFKLPWEIAAVEIPDLRSQLLRVDPLVQQIGHTRVSPEAA
jgi:hypothetical protein